MKRTKKEFTDYNEYRDRPFGLKWSTAFAMDELVKSIHTSEKEATRDPEPLKQMSREDIDQVLLDSFLYKKRVSIQLNVKDYLGRLLDNVEGFFNGESNEDYFVLGNTIVYWDDVRHAAILSEVKWFDISVFDNPKDPESEETIDDVIAVHDDKYADYFYEED